MILKSQVDPVATVDVHLMDLFIPAQTPCCNAAGICTPPQQSNRSQWSIQASTSASVGHTHVLLPATRAQRMLFAKIVMVYPSLICCVSGRSPLSLQISVRVWGALVTIVWEAGTHTGNLYSQLLDPTHSACALRGCRTEVLHRAGRAKVLRTSCQSACR